MGQFTQKMSKIVTFTTGLGVISALSAFSFGYSTLCVAMGNQGGPKRQLALTTAPENTQAQFQADVTGTVENSRSAKSLYDFEASGYTSRDIFANVLALDDMGAWPLLCNVLGGLAPEGLANFEDQLSSPGIEQVLPCAAALNEKLNTYWQQSKSLLDQHLSELGKSGRPALNKLKIKVAERPIKISSTPVVERSFFKPGEIALGFNTGPHGSRTPRILDILKAAGVRAHFFQVGAKIRKDPTIDRRLIAENHVIGSNTFSHPRILRMDLNKIRREITEGRRAIEAGTGVDPVFFQFPYGLAPQIAQDIAKEEKVTSVPWTMEVKDWQIQDARALYDQVIAEMDREKGGVLSFRDVSEPAVLVLPAILQEIQARGYTVIVLVPQK